MILYSDSWKRTNRPHGCSVSSILGSYNIFFTTKIYQRYRLLGSTQFEIISS